MVSSSVLTNPYVSSPGDRDYLLINFKTSLFPKASMPALKKTRNSVTLGEKIAYLSFRVSVSVFVLVSQCKLKWVIFLYFFICHFFTHALQVIQIIKICTFPTMQKADITLIVRSYANVIWQLFSFNLALRENIFMHDKCNTWLDPDTVTMNF